MSHYPCAVIYRPDQSVEDLLAPYDENLVVPKYVEFTKQEAIDYARNYFDVTQKTDEQCWEIMAKDAGPDMVDEDGNIYSVFNRESHWDWWVEGGRWNGMLKLKNGSRANSARIRDIDFSPDEEAKRRFSRFWDVVVEHQPKLDGEDIFSIYDEKYYRDYYGDRDTYIRHQSNFSTFAVITPDGAWHACGSMRWWGVSSETPEEARDWHDHYMERFIESADENLRIAIVDCHI